MAHYMLQFSYSADAWAALTKNPVDRSSGIAALCKKLGGKFVGLHYTMGEYDGLAILDAPDDTTANAIVLAAAAPGHIRKTKTTRLYSPAEMVDVLKKAQGAGYKAPQG